MADVAYYTKDEAKYMDTAELALYNTVAADRRARCADAGRVALKKGPVVYCLERQELTFVPYAFRGNRTGGEMIVWVREKM